MNTSNHELILTARLGEILDQKLITKGGFRDVGICLMYFWRNYRWDPRSSRLRRGHRQYSEGAKSREQGTDEAPRWDVGSKTYGRTLNSEPFRIFAEANSRLPTANPPCCSRTPQESGTIGDLFSCDGHSHTGEFHIHPFRVPAIAPG